MRNIRNTLKQSGEWDIQLKNNFTKLKLKIFFQVLITPIISMIIGYFILKIFIDGILQRPFANGFVSFCIHILGYSEEQSLNFYQLLFRYNKIFWIILGYTIIMFIIFYYSLSRLIRYFNEVSKGMDHLLDEVNNEIILSPEIEPMEKKLNLIKSNLIKKEQDAQIAEQRKNDLVIYLAHDIKTPLTSVIGYLSLLDEAPDMPDAQKAKYIKVALDKAFRLEQLINEFFEITRYNLQTILLEKQEINLTYMLIQMADEFYPQLTATGMKAVVDAEDNLMIYADPDKLARVFNNIMKNAIAYGYDNSTIEIAAVLQDSNVMITFSNHGSTIPAHKLESIFDKFYRLDDSRSSSTGGSGLGLAIAKSIVTSHGGTIHAESADEHTVFSVTLPVHTA